MTEINPLDPLLDSQQAADYFHVSKRTFVSWRYDSDDYPPAIRVGKHLRYRKSDLDAWLDSRVEQPRRSA